MEALQTDDIVITSSGQQRRLSWIGCGRSDDAGRCGAATPVIVRKGALSDNVPHHDLHITKGHSLYLDGALIPVEYLVNHRSILWDDHAQEVTVYHLELDTHDVLLANGAPAESYRDDGNRWLFGTPTPAGVNRRATRTSADWRASRGCNLAPPAGTHRSAPRLCADRRSRSARAGGRPAAGCRGTAGNGTHLPPAGPAGLVAYCLACRRPGGAGPGRDPRVLGVAIWRIALHQGMRFHSIEQRTYC